MAEILIERECGTGEKKTPALARRRQHQVKA
jgi:hypothetical protein